MDTGSVSDYHGLAKTTPIQFHISLDIAHIDQGSLSALVDSWIDLHSGKRFFDIIAMADEFILWDDMKYPRDTGCHNGNSIKMTQVVLWLTVPMTTKARHLHSEVN